MTTKLRRHESFAISWSLDLAYGSGRVALWLHPGIPLTFAFSGSRVPPRNPTWVEAMLLSASSSQGLVLMSEQEAERIVRAAAPRT